MNQSPSPPVLMTLGPKGRRKPQVNGLEFLHQLLRKSRLERGMKMGLNGDLIPKHVTKKKDNFEYTN
jgi:hypothetical protein